MECVCFVTEEEGYWRVVTGLCAIDPVVSRVDMRHCCAAAAGGRMAFSIFGPCSLYRKQSPATVRRMSRLGKYDPSPVTCVCVVHGAVRRAKVVEAALIHTNMPYSNTGRTKPQYTIVRCFGSSTADAVRRKLSRYCT